MSLCRGTDLDRWGGVKELRCESESSLLDSAAQSQGSSKDSELSRHEEQIASLAIGGGRTCDSA